MSTSAPKTIHLLGLFPAVVNAEEIVLPVRVGAEVVHLRGSLQLMQSLCAEVAAVLPTGKRLAVSRAPQSVIDAHRLYLGDRRVTAADLAQTLGLPLRTIRHEFAKLNQLDRAKGRAPIRKPGGKIL